MHPAVMMVTSWAAALVMGLVAPEVGKAVKIIQLDLFKRIQQHLLALTTALFLPAVQMD
jgi:hypothetical protein